MPAMPATPPPDRKLTYEDYCAIPEDGKRHEILDGVEYVLTSPRLNHQRILGRLSFELQKFLEANPLGEVFFAPTDVLLGPHDIVVPDLLFVSKENAGILTDANVRGPPDLVVEVLSPSNRRHDMIRKRRRFEVHGVPEYWWIDPEVEAATILRLGEDGRYQRVMDLSLEDGGGDLTSLALPGFALPLERLFE